MSDRIYNVLFLCTGNTARSVLAESILRKDGRRHFRAFSAGSQPKGTVNPFAIKVLKSADYPTDDLRSVWPGRPMTAHWGIEDPAAVEGTDIVKEAAFVEAFRYMKNRIAAFTSLPLTSIDALSLGMRLRDIGRLRGATSGQEKAS